MYTKTGSGIYSKVQRKQNVKKCVVLLWLVSAPHIADYKDGRSEDWPEFRVQRPSGWHKKCSFPNRWWK